MANVTLSISRSDWFPVGTVVKVYPIGARVFAGQPSGPSLSEATVDANGKLAVTVAGKNGGYLLYALVGAAHRNLVVGDPTAAGVPETGTLRERRRRRRALVGAA